MEGERSRPVTVFFTHATKSITFEVQCRVTMSLDKGQVLRQCFQLGLALSVLHCGAVPGGTKCTVSRSLQSSSLHITEPGICTAAEVLLWHFRQFHYITPGTLLPSQA